MILVDSNIIIYAAKQEYSFLLPFIEANAPRASAISYVEVVGYLKLTNEDRRHFERFFANADLVPITEPIIQRAAQLRQERKVSVADAIIAATALTGKFTLVTRNTQDFDWISTLKLLNPFESIPL